MTVTRDKVVDYLQSEHGLDTSTLDDATPLFTSGTLDSFSMVDLVVLLEREGGFRMTPSEVSLDNLDTIDRILTFVQTKLG